jgi:hypothetical protein
MLVLIASIGLVWLVGRTPSNVPTLGAPVASTPTPRALTILRETPTLTPAPAVPTATSASAVEEEQTVPATPTETPELLAMLDGAEPAWAANGAVLEAPGTAELSSLAAGSWRVSANTLRNEGSSAVAEPWLMLASVPGPAFAVEAEIRVNGLLDTVCDQSFGLTGGNPDTEEIYGGGLLFPCSKQGTVARLTDVTTWQDGYNADPVIADNAFDPGREWRTYRFEVRGDQLRLIVDGVGVVSSLLPDPVELEARAEAGLWTQGVNLEVRSVAVYRLPSR